MGKEGDPFLTDVIDQPQDRDGDRVSDTGLCQGHLCVTPRSVCPVENFRAPIGDELDQGLRGSGWCPPPVVPLRALRNIGKNWEPKEAPPAGEHSQHRSKTE